MAGTDDLTLAGFRHDAQGRRILRAITAGTTLDAEVVLVGGRVRSSDGAEEIILEVEELRLGDGTADPARGIATYGEATTVGIIVGRTTAGNFALYLGREMVADWMLAIADNPDGFAIGAVAGDLVIRPETGSVRIHMPASNGAQLAYFNQAREHVIVGPTKGLILQSPDGNFWRGTISNAGALSWANLGAGQP